MPPSLISRPVVSEAHRALHRSAEHTASDFLDERTLLNVDGSAEMRALMIKAGLLPAGSFTASTAASDSSNSMTEDSTEAARVRWPVGQDLGATHSATRARERFLAMQPKVNLWDSQLQGIAFIQHIERERPANYAGGVIADEMGLGKYVLFFSFFLHV